MRLTFTVLGLAAPQGSFRAAVSKKNPGRAFLVQSCKRTMPWRQEVAAVAYEASVKAGPPWPTTEAVELSVDFFLPRPKGHFNSKGLLKPKAPLYPAKKPDLSKLLRAAEDALTGIVYDDDARIVSELTRKLFCAPGEGPRAVFLLEILQGVAQETPPTPLAASKPG